MESKNKLKRGLSTRHIRFMALGSAIDRLIELEPEDLPAFLQQENLGEIGRAHV